ncbi:hypothetical protein AGLY_014344 [Aphis glycines]|uniref:Transmembrane protein n=1 Tax=Aphis glycines TaxID=307491 RepID=A0A6G0T3R2_APHGL|nr:hypothetical protein AGLY_014344 [Aphis glycines]
MYQKIHSEQSEEYIGFTMIANKISGAADIPQTIEKGQSIQNLETFKKLIIIKVFFSETKIYNVIVLYCIPNITNLNNLEFNKFFLGFRCLSEYPWCIIKIKSKHFPKVFKKIEKNKKNVTEKQEFSRKTSFWHNRFFYMVVTQKLVILVFSLILTKIHQNHEYLQIIWKLRVENVFQILITKVGCTVGLSYGLLTVNLKFLSPCI